MPQVCDPPAAAEAVRPKRRPAPFGYQLLLDLYDCRRGAADDLGRCYDFLEALVGILKVEPQSPPFIFRTDAKRYPDKAGLSGWIPLVESGIQIHTLSEKDFISIDIYSCRRFSTDPITDLVRSTFAPKRIDDQFIERGVDYHR